MKKNNLLIFCLLVSMVFMCACGKKDKLTANLGPASDSSNSSITGCIYEDSDVGSKTENRLEKGDSDIKDSITLKILGKEYTLLYNKSEWNLGVGWVDIYKSQDKNVKVCFESESEDVFSVSIDTYMHTGAENYVPSDENGIVIKTEDEFEELAKKYIKEIFGDIDYNRYKVTKDFSLTRRDYGSFELRDPAIYSLDLYLNGIKTGEHIGVDMNIYGDFVACSRKNIGAYDDLDVDYLIETGLLTDKACEVAGETIKEKYKEYGKEVTEVTYDTDQDVFCLDEDGKPIRIVHCHITLENGDTDSRRVVVGIEE